MPSSKSSLAHGRYVWHELLTGDVDAALAFYASVTGWTSQTMEFPGAEQPYTMFVNDGTPLGGVYTGGPTGAGVRPGWMPYLGTDDADATCRDAITLGATLLMSPTDIPTVGRTAMFADREGAQVAILAPESAATPETMPGIGEFAWHEMAADDPERSLALYTRLFGWEKQRAMDMGSDGVYQMFGRGDFTYGGFMGRRAEMPAPLWNCYIRVANLDASLDAVRRGGGRILTGPHDVPSDDRVATAVDDQGAVFSLVARR